MLQSLLEDFMSLYVSPMRTGKNNLNTTMDTHSVMWINKSFNFWKYM